MDEKKNVSLAVVIIHCFCAVIWNVNVILKLVAKSYDLSFYIHIVAAVLWDICAVLWICRYVKGKKEKS